MSTARFSSPLALWMVVISTVVALSSTDSEPVFARLLPPAEEQRYVGDFRRAERDDLLVDGLEVGRLPTVALQGVPHDDPLERLLGRQEPHRAEKIAFRIVERPVERAAEVVVVDGARERVVRG